jgi:hypothetical protein
MVKQEVYFSMQNKEGALSMLPLTLNDYSDAISLPGFSQMGMVTTFSRIPASSVRA